jgi:hypothetical protein
MARTIKEGKTNYFQLATGGLTAPTNVAANQKDKNGERMVEISWNTAFAGNDPLKSYEILRDGKLIATIDHKPQTTKNPFTFSDKPAEGNHEYIVKAVDLAGNRKESGGVRV